MSKNKNGNGAPGATPETKTATAAVATPKVELSNVSIGPRVEEQKPEAIKPTQAENPKPVTIEQRKKNAELFEILLKKEEAATAAKQKMDSFLIGTDEHSQTVSIKDKNNNSFSTGNPIIIGQCIDLIKAHINLQCGVIETEILNFII